MLFVIGILFIDYQKYGLKFLREKIRRISTIRYMGRFTHKIDDDFFWVQLASQMFKTNLLFMGYLLAYIALK